MAVSVVIPALNESARIEETLRSVRMQHPRPEIVVADGGSVDQTKEIAKRYASVIDAPRGRAAQMNAGAEASSGDVLLFLHADTSLSPGAINALRQSLADGAVAGTFRLRFDRQSLLLRLYELGARIPWHRLAFGDRGLFVTRDAFEAIGGYPVIPLFEDIEAVRALRRLGAFAYLSHPVVTAARRFEKHGALRQQLRNLNLWTRYALGADPHSLARHYTYP